MLPVRLGMLNAKGPQDLVLYVLTPQGRVETTNYRTVKLPANMDLPTFVRDEFGPTYKALFDAQAAREDYRAIFTEYFWDMSWCDPCAADPLTADELRQAGVFWLDAAARARRQPAGDAHAVCTFATRATRCPRTWCSRKPPTARTSRRATCCATRGAAMRQAAARPPAYFEEVARRQEHEAATLASLTGWDVDAIRARMALAPQAASRWWEALWK